MEPVATIVPLPDMRRGTEATVPMPPGFVSWTLAPCMSSPVSLLSRALAIRSLNASRKPRKLRRPASLMTGTISVRLPRRSTSTAMPRLTWPASTRTGLPSSSFSYVWAMTGICSVAARAMA
ncbi:unannotated protein [freshwater metagenome]|uniref:Unannotated protein n=1 Tax=freshwater metagenome TaxID=449393 RepID=A0A6J7IER2_9ZZZZ